MTSFVKRTNTTTGREGWAGPIRSVNQAEREAQAWRAEGWNVEVLPVNAETRAQVKAWEAGR